ncbi:hypothetical protein CIB95_03540 [Lottiidibacillus patelloidae]|uniref:Uncharacterized protein n=1 Tax=Lottiidibacillus patelloidae TaxID=2670334 RepID=A0A263BY44_9BACI|nr:hypothetical protein [Lottiidibacillus patelloidae]OZM58653.1 hypothetical protein CIB95_03540 [Lottiidibacillus patelloidae]
MDDKIRQTLSLHQVSTSNYFNKNFLSVKIVGAQFHMLAVRIWVPTKKRWISLKEGNNFFKSKEMIHLALQCLYYVNIPIGVCVIQRGLGGKCHVYSIKEKRAEELPNVLQRRLEQIKEQSPFNSELTFGADVEGLLYHEKRKKYITASSLFKQNDRLGYDNAMIVRENKTKNHILELRPLPGKNGKELYTNLVLEYEKLLEVTRKYDLSVIGGANPVSSVMLGGHIHVGNKNLNFQVVRTLDLFFGIPMSLTEDQGAVQRRKTYGRLGSVKMNKYNGFEYRTLPSWIEQIPDMLPVFRWYCLLLKNAHLFQDGRLPSKLLNGYYTQNNKFLETEVKKVHGKALSVLHRPSHKEIANEFFELVLEKSVSNNKEFAGNML